MLHLERPPRGENYLAFCEGLATAYHLKQQHKQKLDCTSKTGSVEFGTYVMQLNDRLYHGSPFLISGGFPTNKDARFTPNRQLAFVYATKQTGLVSSMSTASNTMRGSVLEAYPTCSSCAAAFRSQTKKSTSFQTVKSLPQKRVHGAAAEIDKKLARVGLYVPHYENQVLLCTLPSPRLHASSWLKLVNVHVVSKSTLSSSPLFFRIH